MKRSIVVTAFVLESEDCSFEEHSEWITNELRYELLRFQKKHSGISWSGVFQYHHEFDSIVFSCSKCGRTAVSVAAQSQIQGMRDGILGKDGFVCADCSPELVNDFLNRSG